MPRFTSLTDATTIFDSTTGSSDGPSTLTINLRCRSCFSHFLESQGTIPRLLGRCYPPPIKTSVLIKLDEFEDAREIIDLNIDDWPLPYDERIDFIDTVLEKTEETTRSMPRNHNSVHIYAVLNLSYDTYDPLIVLDENYMPSVTETETVHDENYMPYLTETVLDENYMTSVTETNLDPLDPYATETVLDENDDVIEILAQLSIEESSYCMIPATESAIGSLEKKKYTGFHDDCPICLEDFSSLECEVTSMPCSHVFHWDCIQRWLRTSRYCPVCRFEMPTNDV